MGFLDRVIGAVNRVGTPLTRSAERSVGRQAGDRPVAKGIHEAPVVVAHEL